MKVKYTPDGPCSPHWALRKLNDFCNNKGAKLLAFSWKEGGPLKAKLDLDEGYILDLVGVAKVDKDGYGRSAIERELQSIRAHQSLNQALRDAGVRPIKKES